MQTKLTLRLEREIIENAKNEARKRGTSVSKMVADYFTGIQTREGSLEGLPPLTASLLGSLKGRSVHRERYRLHLEKKYR